MAIKKAIKYGKRLFTRTKRRVGVTAKRTGKAVVKHRGKLVGTAGLLVGARAGVQIGRADQRRRTERAQFRAYRQRMRGR